MKEIDVDFGKKTRITYLILCMCGSLLTLYSRNIFYAQDTYEFPGCPIQKFNKPWFATLFMAVGMSLANILYQLFIVFSKDPPISFSKVHFSMYLHAIVPAAMDIIFSVLYSISILLIGSTFSTIIRFLDLVFATILRKFWLKETLLPYSWISLIVIIIGVILVSIAASINDIGSIQINGQFIVAAIIQICAQLASSFKAIREEQLLHQNDIHPVWLCGVEGVYEFVLILFILYPILNFMPKKFGEGLTEDFCAACQMMIHSKTLIGALIVYLFIACLFNTCVMGVQYSSNAIQFIVSENIVNSISWGIDLLIFYTMDGSIFGLTPKDSYGTEWTNLSYLRLVGVIFIILGSIVYVKFIKLPFFKYEDSNVKLVELDEINLV